MRRNWIGLLLMIAVVSTTTSALSSFAFAFRHLSLGSSRSQSLLSLSARSSIPTTSTSTSTIARNKMTGSDNNRKKRPLSATTSTSGDVDGGGEEQLYLEEGLFAVRKPLGWTSQDVVGKLRFVLETDARERGAPDPRTKKRRPWMKVGHGGTLDPLATGVLVCGVGSGTRSLQKYLVGSKRYRAEVTLGYQTTTLDADPKGEVVEEKPYDHVVSLDEIDGVLQSKFTGNIQQIPPIFSALKRDGKKLYELGRKGKTAEDIKIEPRQVVVYDLKLVRPPRDGESERQGDDNTDGSNNNSSQQQQSRLPPPPIQKFQIDVECGGGTYIRSLVRDIGIELGTVATMTALDRTKQGLFLPEHCVPYQLLGTDETEKDIQKDENGVVFIDKKQDCNWTVETITEAIRSCRNTVLASEDDGLKKEDRPTD